MVSSLLGCSCGPAAFEVVPGKYASSFARSGERLRSPRLCWFCPEQTSSGGEDVGLTVWLKKGLAGGGGPGGRGTGSGGGGGSGPNHAGGGTMGSHDEDGGLGIGYANVGRHHGPNIVPHTMRGTAHKASTDALRIMLDALGAVALSLWSRCPHRHLAGTGAESSRKQWFFENSSR